MNLSLEHDILSKEDLDTILETGKYDKTGETGYSSEPLIDVIVSGI